MSSFPSQPEPTSGQSIPDHHNPHSFTLVFPLDGIWVMSEQIDICVPPLSSGECFHSGCRPSSASSHIWVLTISAVMYRPHLLDAKRVAWSGPCTPLISSTVCSPHSCAALSDAWAISTTDKDRFRRDLKKETRNRTSLFWTSDHVK